METTLKLHEYKIHRFAHKQSINDTQRILIFDFRPKKNAFILEIEYIYICIRVANIALISFSVI